MTIINAKGSDQKFKITGVDTRTNFAEDKLIAGPGVTITKVTAGDGSQTLVFSAGADDPDTFGLHYLKCRVENGCVINMEVRPIFDQTVCFIKKVAC